MPTLPVTVLSGFLGAGKTTLVNHLLKSDTDTRYAVLVNDLADINLREIKLKPGKTELQWNPRSGKLEGLVELHNGCICCTLREEFVSEVYDLAKLDKFDHLLIEASGVAEPIPIALAFDLEMPDGNPLQAHAPLDTLITVVDAHHFLKDWESAQKLRELGLNVDESDERTQAELLAEQVEFADIIIINKVDLVSEQELKRLRQLLNCINPGADIHTSMFGQVEHAKLISAPGPRPTRELTPLLASQRNLALHDQLEITTYVYRARRPFHPVRFWECINQEWPGIMRSKGLFWLATRMNDSGVWSQASSASNHQGGGRWWSAVPPEQWPTDPQATSAINLEFKGPFGDRRQEIVLIGSNLNRDEIKARLDACLLNDSELVIGSVGWRQLEDPFPAWESDDPDETEIMLTPFPKNVPSA